MGHLIVTRRRFERIRINDNIDVQVIDIRGGKVRLGITAPNDVSIQRQEVYERLNGGSSDDAESDATNADHEAQDPDFQV